MVPKTTFLDDLKLLYMEILLFDHEHDIDLDKSEALAHLISLNHVLIQLNGLAKIIWYGSVARDFFD